MGRSDQPEVGRVMPLSGVARFGSSRSTEAPRATMPRREQGVQPAATASRHLNLSGTGKCPARLA